MDQDRKDLIDQYNNLLFILKKLDEDRWTLIHQLDEIGKKLEEYSNDGKE